MIRALAMVALAATTSGCAVVGQGEGAVRSERLHAPECWDGAFDLRPDFFAAVPLRDTLQIRVQRGGDHEEVSDGVQWLVNDVLETRALELGKPLDIGLAPQLAAAIAPSAELGSAPRVTLSLGLHSSCHHQNVVLYALSGTITFQALFSGDPNEPEGAERYTEARFEATLADPRDALPGTLEVPAEKTSRVEGFFAFHFQRGQPGQPFPRPTGDAILSRGGSGA